MPDGNNPETTDVERMRAAWLKMSAAVMTIVQNHMLGLASAANGLNETDLQMGNTYEHQQGFDDCLAMVTTDYIEPLVKAHNEMAVAIENVKA